MESISLILRFLVENECFACGDDGAAAYILRGDSTRLNFPHRRHGDEVGSSSGTGDSGVTSSASPIENLVSSTLETKLQWIAYQTSLRAKREGDNTSLPHSEPDPHKTGLPIPQQQESPTSALRSESTFSANAGVDVHHLHFRQGGDYSSSSSPCCPSPPSPSSVESKFCASSPGSDASNNDNNNAAIGYEDSFNISSFDIDNLLNGPYSPNTDMSWDVCFNEPLPATIPGSSNGVGVGRKQAHIVSSATLSPPGAFNVWRQCLNGTE